MVENCLYDDEGTHNEDVIDDYDDDDNDAKNAVISVNNTKMKHKRMRKSQQHHHQQQQQQQQLNQHKYRLLAQPLMLTTVCFGILVIFVFMLCA